MVDDPTNSIHPGVSMAGKGNKTGSRPSGNKKGMQGSGIAGPNPKGMKAAAPVSIMATGRGPKSGKKQT